MTREEAKEILTHNWTRVDNPNYSESELDEAFFMAIEALSKPNYETDTEVILMVTNRKKEKVILCDSYGELEYVQSADADTYTRITGLVPDARPQMEHDKEWIIGCIKHDGFIKTDRFDTANQIILDALEPQTDTDLISRADVLKYPIRLNHYDEENGSRVFVYGVESVIEYVESLPSAEAVSREDYEDIIKDYRKQYENMNNEIADLEAKLSADAVHGEWLYVENEPYSECSKCGRYIDDLDEDEYAYCPYCGARMYKGGDDE